MQEQSLPHSLTQRVEFQKEELLGRTEAHKEAKHRSQQQQDVAKIERACFVTTKVKATWSGRANEWRTCRYTVCVAC